MMHEAFVDLIQSQRERLERVCRFYERDPEWRRDLFGEIVCQVWRSMGRFEERSDIGTWIYRIALNTAVSHVRRMARHPRALSLEAAQNLPSAPAAGPGEAELEALHRLIDRLDPLEQQLVLLYLEGRTAEGIGAVLGISAANAAVRLTRVRDKMQRLEKGE